MKGIVMTRLANIRTMSAVNLAACFLITLGTLPLLMMHTWEATSGPARVALVGFVLFDVGLWTASHLATRGHSPLVRAVALASKVGLAVLAILCAASVLALRGDRLTDERNRATHATQERARMAELANLAERLAASSGRSVAREFLQSAPAAPPAPSMSALGSWLEVFPSWWPSLGIVACPTLAGLFVLSLLGALVGLAGGGQDERIDAPAETLPERRAGFHSPMPSFANLRRQEMVPTAGPTPPASGHPDAGQEAPSVRYERKRNGRVEAWLVDGTATRGKRYLTGFSGSLTAAEQAARVQAALQRKAVA
jgi:hypothetical protein